MPFYIRKSVSVGPFRFNLSKSGVGLSTGVKGFRVGTGPKGSYVHMGAGGIYYRKTLSASQASDQRQGTPPPVPAVAEESLAPGEEAIESGSALQMAPATAKELLEQINTAKDKFLLWPWLAAVGAAIAALTWPSGNHYISLSAAAATLIVSLACRRWETPRHKVVMMYDLEGEALRSYGNLVEAFALLGQSKVWHVSSTAPVLDGRRNANAAANLRRDIIAPTCRTPGPVVTNVDVPAFPVGKQTLYFFPDRVLFEAPEGMGAVEYDELSVTVAPSFFIEDGTPPADAKVVGHRWQYINRDGTRDRRFNNNRELPVCEYRELQFTSPTGLNERVMISRTDIPEAFAEALDDHVRAATSLPNSGTARARIPNNVTSGPLS